MARRCFIRDLSLDAEHEADDAECRQYGGADVLHGIPPEARFVATDYDRLYGAEPPPAMPKRRYGMAAPCHKRGRAWPPCHKRVRGWPPCPKRGRVRCRKDYRERTAVDEPRQTFQNLALNQHEEALLARYRGRPHRVGA